MEKLIEKLPALFAAVVVSAIAFGTYALTKNALIFSCVIIGALIGHFLRSLILRATKETDQF